MKLLALPKGGQNGCHGPVVCVPSNVNQVTNMLPRNDGNDLLLRIKLKRKLTYKGHYEYKHVHTNHVYNALDYLKLNNKWYNDISINNEWVNPLEKVTDVLINENQQDIITNSLNNSDSHDHTTMEVCNITDYTPSQLNVSVADVDKNSEFCDNIVPTQMSTEQTHRTSLADEKTDKKRDSDSENYQPEEEFTYIEQTHGLFLDTCLQPLLKKFWINILTLCYQLPLLRIIIP